MMLYSFKELARFHSEDSKTLAGFEHPPSHYPTVAAPLGHRLSTGLGGFGVGRGYPRHLGCHA